MPVHIRHTGIEVSFAPETFIDGFEIVVHMQFHTRRTAQRKCVPLFGKHITAQPVHNTGGKDFSYDGFQHDGSQKLGRFHFEHPVTFHIDIADGTMVSVFTDTSGFIRAVLCRPVSPSNQFHSVGKRIILFAGTAYCISGHLLKLGHILNVKQGKIISLAAISQQVCILQMAEQDLVFSDLRTIVPFFHCENFLELIVVPELIVQHKLKDYEVNDWIIFNRQI